MTELVGWTEPGRYLGLGNRRGWILPAGQDRGRCQDTGLPRLDLVEGDLIAGGGGAIHAAPSLLDQRHFRNRRAFREDYRALVNYRSATDASHQIGNPDV